MSQDTDCHKTSKKTSKKPETALVALGSNQPSGAGSPLATLRAACDRLGDSGLKIRKCSEFYRTPCFPAGSGPDYVNATLSVFWKDSAHALLTLLHQIEADFGRERVQRWGQRVLDLDLIALGDQVLPDLDTHEDWRHLPIELQQTKAPNELILPHPRMQERAFVLVPLAKVAPDWRHPVLGRTVQQMLDDLPEIEKNSISPL